MITDRKKERTHFINPVNIFRTLYKIHFGIIILNITSAMSFSAESRHVLKYDFKTSITHRLK